MKEGGYFTNFSLNKVAKEAGVSKGGLMHHFASKDALLQATARDAIEQFEKRLDQEIESGRRNSEETAVSPKMLRAYIEIVLGEAATHQAELSPILLSYLNANEEGPNRFETWHTRAQEEDVDIVTATIVRLAVDGLLYTELIDKTKVPSELRQDIRKRLLAMLAD